MMLIAFLFSDDSPIDRLKREIFLKSRPKACQVDNGKRKTNVNDRKNVMKTPVFCGTLLNFSFQQPFKLQRVILGC